MNRNKFDNIVSVCSNLLYDYPMALGALDYLNNRLDIKTQKRFSFGFFPHQEELPVLMSLVDETELFETELVYECNKDSGPGHKVLLSTMSDHNLIMPYRDVYGKIIALVGRSLLSDH